jgi:hypothetical protein
MLLDRRDAGLPLRRVRGTVHKHTEPPHAIRLLRTRGERPGRNSTTDEHDEFPSPHGIYSPGREPPFRNSSTIFERELWTALQQNAPLMSALGHKRT